MTEFTLTLKIFQWLKMVGWLKIHRQITSWEWYSDLPVRVTFLHFLFNANWKDREYKGTLVKRGQLLTGSLTTPKEIGISRAQYRRAVDNLKKTTEITTEPTNKGTVVTIVKYNDYQLLEIVDNHQNNHPQNQQTTTLEEDNNNTLSNERVAYASEKDFLADWKKAREHYDSKPTNIAKLTSMERVKFNQANSTYTREQIQQAIEGLFQQKKMYASSRLRPTHFLDDGRIDQYLDCYNNKTQLFSNER